MVKRRISSDEEDQLVNDSSEYSAGESKPKPRSSKREKRTVIKAESDAEHQSEEQQAPSAKKAKKKPTPSTKEQAASGSGDVDIVIHSTPDGDKYIDLGKKKRATVRSFKGTALVDIREFYVADGSEKPGKKGISLALEQWETLKSSSAVIDNLLGSLQKKQK